VLIALGIGPEGKRQILGVSVPSSEAEVHWRDYLRSLKMRGACALQLLVSNEHAGLVAACRAVFHSSPWQRCHFHLRQHVQAYVPRLDLRAQLAADIRSIFVCPVRPSAGRQLEELLTAHSTSAPKLAAWMESALAERFTVFAFAARPQAPPAHHQRPPTLQSGTEAPPTNQLLNALFHTYLPPKIESKWFQSCLDCCLHST
jgi:transposase-like protein